MMHSSIYMRLLECLVLLLFPTVVTTISFTCMRYISDDAYQHNMQLGTVVTKEWFSPSRSYVFCLLTTMKLDLYNPLKFNNIHAPRTSSNATSICIALSGTYERRCNCLLYLSSNHAIKYPQFHLYLLFSTTCLHHVSMHPDVRRQIIPLNNFVSHQELNRLYDSYDTKSTKFQLYVTDISGFTIIWHFMQTT